MKAQTPASNQPIRNMSAAKPGSKALPYAIAALIVIIIIAGAAFVLTGRQITTTETTSINVTTIAGAHLGGPLGSYMSQQEAQALFGPGGTYNVTYRNGTEYQSWVRAYQGYQQFLFNSTSSVWIVQYDQKPVPAGTGGVSNFAQFSEYVYIASDPKTAYDGFITGSNQIKNIVINATLDGMLYTLTTSNSSGQLGSSYIAIITGMKHDEVSSVSVGANHPINIQALLTTVSGDMP